MGAPIVTTHPGRIPEDRSTPAYQTLLRAITDIARHGEQCGGIFCIETGQESAADASPPSGALRDVCSHYAQTMMPDD